MAPPSPSPSAPRVVLLFCHGGGLHKGVWTPIQRRLRAAGVACEFVAIDWRYHGENSCDDEPATLFYEGNSKRHPRVAHPASHWPQWTTDEVRETVAEMKSEDAKLGRTTRVIGVGHSMGAAALLKVEVVTPGTFDGLVVFEPALSFEAKMFGGMTWASSWLVGATLAREDTWNSRDEAVAYIKNSIMYRHWHPECLDAYIQGALRASSDGKRVRLATPVLHEAAIFCHEIMDFTRQSLAKVQSKVVFMYGSHTGILNVFGVLQIVDAAPDRISVAEALPKLSHMSIMENPDLCAQRIYEQLMTFPAFQAAHNAPSRL